jgi:DNA-binding response OmpR family regulator
MTERLLIVDPDAASQRVITHALAPGRYRTMLASAFERANQLLHATPPDLLITVVRLGAFNGLHLVALGRGRDQRMAAIVLDERHDTVREREAAGIGAAYLPKPAVATELLRCVTTVLAGRERRWWSRISLASHVMVGVGDARERLLDISYGGFRLESGSLQRHEVLTLELPILGLRLNAARVWTSRAEGDKVWSCGAALVAPMDSEGTQRWRRLVDTLRARPSFTAPKPRR